MIDVIAAAALAAGLAVAQQHQHPPAPPSQQTPPPAQQHQHPAPEPVPSQPAPRAWHFMQDGVAFVTWNRQMSEPPADGRDRSDNELVSQNWWMGMASRPAGGGTLTFSLMLSADRLTQYGDGYASLFQSGETWQGRPVIDRQHPHDFLMQASVLWTAPIGRGYTLMLSGAPVGEPTLGPVAFMHRQSAAEMLSAPLGHHTLDSTHISNSGVLAAGLSRGAWTVESSLFRGKEPDENRWDLMDPGPLDSWAVRGWYRPSPRWEFQVSHGFLNEPEALEHTDIRRTTASASWVRTADNGFTAVSLIGGYNDKSEGYGNSALLAEATHRVGRTAIFSRFESVEVETDVLLFGGHLDDHHGDPPVEPSRVNAITAGVVRDLLTWKGFEVAAGGDFTLFRPGQDLRTDYGRTPTSFHVFLRVRPPAPMGRMWNHVMTRPMAMQTGGHAH